VLLPFLNTGGGHRSAALAVAEALQELYGRRVHPELVDVTTDYFPWPLRKLDAVYNQLVRHRGWPWALVYHLSDNPRRFALLAAGWRILTRGSTQSLLRHHPADAIVCCHPLLKAPIARALEASGSEVPLITLVTDLASGHAAWFHPSDGEYLVATEEAQAEALACGVSHGSIRVTGLPVRPCFARTAEQDPRSTRKALGLDNDSALVLLLSGADAIGPFYELVEALMSNQTEAQFAAITGRNERLRTKLVSRQWPRPLRVMGFVKNVHQWMHAADVLVTKAGPTTIAEALVVGSPMVLSGAVPGQEPPNIPYVTESGAGIWAPTVDRAAEVVGQLLSSPTDRLQAMTRRAKPAGCPYAAWDVARIVWESASGRRGRPEELPESGSIGDL
jgi:1,2-diacylglycerol 3-beta-galactosyltransferase